jgi:hypothetical protein
VKYAKKSQLTEALMELLSIEREAVYRRLRKEVLFSSHDIVKIANAWNISLDNLLGIASDESRLFQMDILSYHNPSEKDLKVIGNYFNFLDIINPSPALEYMEISNTLPQPFLGNYPALFKFYMFKWLYHYGNEKNVPSFEQFTLPEITLELGKKYYGRFKHISSISCMWDELNIKHLINNIRYFESIYFLRKEDVELLKQEIYTFLNDIENLSIQGGFAETNNKVELYISQVNIDTNYYYFYSPEVTLCGLRTFIKYTAASTDKSVCENFKRWMLARKKVSIPISQVNERQRIEFFKQQREMIKELEI